MKKWVISGLGVLAVSTTPPAQRPPTHVLSGTNSHALAAAGQALCVVATTNTGALFRRSDDGGGTWSPQVVISGTNSCNCDDPKVAVRGNVVFAVWERNCSFFAPSEVCFNRSLDGGATWLPTPLVQPFVSGGTDSYEPDVVATDNAVCVLWRGRVQFGGDNQVHCRASSNDGTTWSPVTMVSGNIGNAGRFRAVAEGTGVFVTWIDYIAPSNEPYFNRSLDDGATWLAAPVRLNSAVPPGTFSARDPGIAVDGTTVAVIFRDARDWPGGLYFSQGDIYCNHSLDGGTTWNGDVRVGPGAPGTTECLEPHLAVEGSNVHVVWREPLNTYWGVKTKRSTDSGATWSQPETRLDNGPGAASGFSFRPRIAASTDAVVVAWTEARPFSASDSVFVNRSFDGGTNWLPTDIELLDNSQSNNAVELAVEGSAAYVTSQTTNSVRHNIPFGYVPYGSGTPGTAGLVPRVAGVGAAGIGETFSVDIVDGLGSSLALLGAGAGPASKISVQLPSGTLLVAPDVLFGFQLNGSGGASLSISAPNNPALLGQTWNFQGVVLDPGSIHGLTLTNGLELWLG